MHLMRGAAAAHQFHTACAEEALPQGLIEVHGLYLRERNLRHLDVEDAVLLHETRIRDGELGPSADDSPDNPDEEGQHKQGYACVEECLLVLRELVVGKYEGYDASNRKEERIEEIPEDVRPMKPSVVDDLFALLKALSDVVCHSFTYFLCKDMMF